MIGRMHFRELSIVCQLRYITRLNTAQRVRQGHLAEMMMVSVALAIRRNVRELRPRSLVRESAEQPIGESFSVTQ